MVQTFPVKLTFSDKKNKWEKIPAVGRGVNWQDWNDGHEGSENFGVIIPEGYVIIDLDPKGDQGLGELQAECEIRWGIEVDWTSSLLQTTPSGGAHYGFEIDWQARQSQEDSAPYDTRVAGIGWICSGKNYHEGAWGILDAFDGLSLPNLEPIDELMFKATVDVDDFTAYERSDVSEDDVLAQLEKLDSKDPGAVDDEDSWSKVGRIISFELGEDGLELFKEWSSKSDKYDEREVDRKWSSWELGKGAPMRFGSLVHMAKKSLEELITDLESCDIKDLFTVAGELEGLDQIQMMRRNELIKERIKSEIGKAPTDAQINKSIRVAADERNDEWLSDYVGTSSGEFINKDTAARYNKAGFDLKHGLDAPLDQNGNPQGASFFANGRIDVVDMEVYEPCIDDLLFKMDGLQCFNTYREGGCDVGGEGEGWAAFNKQLNHLLASDEAELLLYWLAHNLQFPGKIIGWAPVLKGCQGDGKSFFGETMQHVLGLRNIRQLDPRQLTTDFSGWAEGQVLTFVEEVRVNNGRFDVMNAFKPYVTNETIDVTGKGKDSKSVPNRTNYLFFTNYEDALPLKDGDRRFGVMKTLWQDRRRLVEWEQNEGKGYYKNLYKAMRTDPGSIKKGLIDVDIPEWFTDMAVAPETNGTKDMIDASKSECQVDIEELLADGEIGGDVVRLDVLRVICDENGIELPSTRAMKHLMGDVGYPFTDRIKLNGVMVTIYTKAKMTRESIRISL